MKKASIILLVILLLSISFLGGLFLGRSLNRSEVRISQSETTTPTTAPTTASVPEPDSNHVININTATVLELATLPGIGEVIAQRIVDYRTEHGGFKDVGQLAEVEGIGEKRLNTLLDYITVGGQS